jgi:outer membrane protein assembly factor BamB
MIGQLLKGVIILTSAALMAGCSLGGGSLTGAQDAPTVDITAPELAITERWSTRIGRSETAYHRLEIAAANDRLYVASAKGKVSALDRHSGELIWEHDLDVKVAGGPSVGDGLVVVANQQGQVIALDTEHGSLRWQASVSSEVLAPAAVGQGRVVVRTGDGRVFALASATGEQQWLYSRSVPALSLRGHSAPVLVPEGVVAGFDNGRLSALDLANGSPVWESTVAVPEGRTDLQRMVDLDADPVVADGDLFAGTYQGRLAGINLRNGEIAWARDISVIGGLAVDSSNIYSTDAEGQLWSLDRSNGASVWRVDALAGLSLTEPALSGEHVVIASSDGHVSWLNPADGQIQARYKVGNARITAPPLVMDEMVYVLDLRGRLKALTIKTAD